MHRARKLIGQRRIDHAVTLKPRFAGEGRLDHRDAEMALSGSGRRMMAGVTVRIVHHLDLRRSERAVQLFPDRLLDTHQNLHPSSLRAFLCRLDQLHRQAWGCGTNFRGNLLKPSHRSVQGDDPHHRIEIGQGWPAIRHVEMGPHGTIAIIGCPRR